MAIQIFWNMCPPDGQYPWETQLRWRPDYKQVSDLAHTVDSLGFAGVLIAIGSHRVYDGWTLASAMIGCTNQMKFLIAVYPGVISPTQLAFMARTFDHLSEGRLMINVVGSNPVAMDAYGIHLPKDQRYEMLVEYWTMFKRIYAGEKIEQPGRFFDPKNPETQFHHIPPTQFPHPPLWGTGGSPEAVATVTGLAETFLVVPGTPQELAKRTEVIRQAAAKHGRTIDHFGLAMSIIIRETEEEAWAVADDMLMHTRLETITGGSGWAAANAPGPHADDPVVQRSIAAIRAGRRPSARDLQSYPNFWSGPNHVTGLDFTRAIAGPGATLIGTPQQVAERMREMHTVGGIDRFIFLGYPLKQEAERVAKLLFPLLDLDHDALVKSAAA